MGSDIIAKKFYKRFLFEKNGFLEIMDERPCAIIAHFSNRNRAVRFLNALKRTINKFVKKEEKIKKLILESITLGKEDEGLTFEKWELIKNIK